MNVLLLKKNENSAWRGAYHAIKDIVHPDVAGFYNLRKLVVPEKLLSANVNPGDYLLVRSEAFRLNDFLHDLAFQVSDGERNLPQMFYDIPLLQGRGEISNVVEVYNNFIGSGKRRFMFLESEKKSLYDVLVEHDNLHIKQVEYFVLDEGLKNEVPGQDFLSTVERKIQEYTQEAR